MNTALSLLALMNPDFSERQYELAVNFELSTELGALMTPAIPLVPTTQEEARQGWDAKLQLGTGRSGYVYFLQYKVAYQVLRYSAWGARFWKHHGGPYFRFHLHENSLGRCHQHELLATLRHSEPGVYYCAPRFAKEDDLWAHVGTRSVLANSVLLDVADLPLRDYDGAHQVSYDDGGNVQTWSEPGDSHEGDRDPRVRLRAENLGELTKPRFAELIARATDVVQEVGFLGRRGQIPGTYLADRVPLRVRAELSDGLSRSARARLPDFLAQNLTDVEILSTAGRIFALDFGLNLVIEPTEDRD